MTINFIAGKFSEERASHRLRGKYISENLQSKGIDSYWGSKLEKIKKNDITVFLKNSTVDHIKSAKSSGSKTIFDVCDNKFEEDKNLKFCCDEADFITCNSVVMSQQILQRFQKQAFFIPDPFERPILPVNFDPGPVVKILWFGSQSSAGYVDWPATWKLLQSKIKNYHLDIISSKAARFREKTIRRIEKHQYFDIDLGKITFHEWNWQLQGQLLQQTDIIILPIDITHHRTITKSANRVIDSLASGKFVITNRLDSYREFTDYIWTKDLAKGINWALSNKDSVNTMVTNGQEYVKTHYSISRISDIWIDYLNKL